MLEEAPAAEPAEASRAGQLVVLSAKSAAALDRATANLREHLAAQPACSLADVAYTLQAGRRVFRHRRMLVCDSREEAIARLEALEPQRVFTWDEDARARPVSFLLPGVGDHYAGMARGLYETEAVFREHLDHCCAILQPLLQGRDLRPLLFPEGLDAETGSGRVDLRRLCGRGPAVAADAALTRPGVAQPAVFAIEYALAQLLLGWGLRPQALLGYSLGEYVAACLAGVFTLEQALTLVAQRARLIEEAEPGAMLAVPLGPTQLAPRLRGAVGLAAINGPAMCVVAGELAGITALEEALAREEIVCRRLPTTHAFHSPQMDAVQQAYTALVSRMPLQAPRIPVVSNVTGTWLTAGEATDPAYWGRHLRQTVQFAEGLGTLLRGVDGVLLEVGPGQLGSMVRQHPAWSASRPALVLPTLRAAYDQQSDARLLLTTLGKLWLAGVDIDWAGFHAGARRRRVPLPTYPFERQRYWIEPRKPRAVAASATAEDGERTQSMASWFYAPAWKQSHVVAGAHSRSEADRARRILFTDHSSLAAYLSEALKQQGCETLEVTMGEAFVKTGPCAYTIDPRNRGDYDRLLAEIPSGSASQVIHMWGMSACAVDAPGPGALTAVLDRGVGALTLLAQALGDRDLGATDVRVIANGIQRVTDHEILHPEAAMLVGPCRVIRRSTTTFGAA